MAALSATRICWNARLLSALSLVLALIWTPAPFLGGLEVVKEYLGFGPALLGIELVPYELACQ
jgi:hypothetical protein